jgi:signal transduction histidine kinase
LNLLLSVFYLGAGILNIQYPPPEFSTLPSPSHTVRQPANVINTNLTVSSNRLARSSRAPDLPYISGQPEETPIEPELPRIILLWLLTICCYGVQVLAERQRRVVEESREFAVREGQLQSAGRLAAEFAHQIKNPLAIINNTVFSMQRALKEGRHDVSKQLDIIREEVERSDTIVTQIMGYAQLSEGRVEKLSLTEELDRAIDQVFPSAADYGVKIERSYASYFPPLLMQRGHLSEIFVNILQNARDALQDKGIIQIKAVCRPDYAIEVSIGDNGPGIVPEKRERIFEEYYSTKEKGTGLGLAIVKHNAELYGGTVRVESELGKGARFILTFPAKTVISLSK